MLQRCLDDILLLLLLRDATLQTPCILTAQSLREQRCGPKRAGANGQVSYRRQRGWFRTAPLGFPWPAQAAELELLERRVPAYKLKSCPK